MLAGDSDYQGESMKSAHIDIARAKDEAIAMASSVRETMDEIGLVGWGIAEHRGPDGELIMVIPFANLITNTGDQFYGERAAGIAAPPAQVTGMQLGTGNTAVAKTGAGSAVVTYVSGSNVAIDSTWPQSSLTGGKRRIQWKTTWGAGVATANGIAEVVIINQAIATNAAAVEANTISRALLSPTVNKGALDTLAITWNHDLLGA